MPLWYDSRTEDRHMKRRLAAVTVVLACALGSVLAQTLPPGVQKKASMGGITEYDFPNGLKVLLYPDAAEPKITVNVTYLVGSRHEGYGETGMAHLLEHMDFIETTNGRKIKDELVARGASWNGTTSDDRTNYYETFTATDDNLRWALGLETDRMVNVKFTKPILDTEMTVVRNEFERGENSPASILSERVASTRVPLAQLRQSRPSARRKTSRKCRWTGWRRSTGSSTSRTTRCW